MLDTYLLLCLSAVAAGVVNAVAGGGTLLTFPVLLVALGSPPEATVIANATSTVALVPGSIASIWGYRREVVAVRKWTFLLAWPSVVGGCLGSMLVVMQPAKVFSNLVPWLILAAALLFALQPQIARWTGVGRHHEAPTRLTLVGIIVFQFFVAIYGGYFGAGAGILMLSALAMMGFDNIHQMNSLKATLGTAINFVAVLVFVWSRQVNWPFAIAMAISAAVGGYFGASIARKLDKKLVRNAVVFIGFGLAAYYFYRQWNGMYLQKEKTVETERQSEIEVTEKTI